MYCVRFETRYIFDHVPRALNELNRMGFLLISLTAEVVDGDYSKIDIRFRQEGNLLAKTYFERLRQMHGVQKFEICE